MERKTKFFIFSIAICMTLMLLSGTMLLLPTASWLSKQNSVTGDSSATTVAQAGIRVFNGSSEISSSNNSNVVLGASGSATSVNIKLKNTGTAQELVRVYYAIKDLDNERVLTTADATVSINSDFIAHERLDTAWAGYLYYNKALDTNTLVSIINSITPTSNYANQTVVIQIQAECVLYSGNAYSTGETTKYPWSSVPSNWFVLS